MLEALENMKTPAINKSEVFGRLFRKLTTLIKNMLECKASMSCSKKPARGETAGGVPTLILLSLSLSSLPPPKKRQDKGRPGRSLAIPLKAWRRSRELLAAELAWGGMVVLWTT